MPIAARDHATPPADVASAPAARRNAAGTAWPSSNSRPTWKTAAAAGTGAGGRRNASFRPASSGACGSVLDESQIGQPCGHSGGVCGTDGNCACPPDQPTACRSGCTDTSTDLNNCGACDTRCRGTAHATGVCVGGVCGLSCDDGYESCGDGCCADGRDCCNGSCCGPNECCAAEGCVPCRCSIGVESFDAGEFNPANACQFCDPTRNRNDWTTAQDGSFCGDGRTCCNAECCSPTECCDGVQCSVDACPDQCEIQGQPFETGQLNPANACQVCEPERNRFDWTLVDDQTACGGVSGRVCCNGECCSPTECCGATSCEECGPHCRIDGEDIDEGIINSANPCEVCQPDVNANDWSSSGRRHGLRRRQRSAAPVSCCRDGSMLSRWRVRGMPVRDWEPDVRSRRHESVQCLRSLRPLPKSRRLVVWTSQLRLRA